MRVRSGGRRFDLPWEPSDRITGIVELQDARIHGEQAISETHR